jgi:hypothetical protein
MLAGSEYVASNIRMISEKGIWDVEGSDRGLI